MSEISMIERVRAAVQAALYEYEQSTMHFKSSMVARAAIEAMREDDLKQLLTERKFQSQYSVAENGCMGVLRNSKLIEK